jgi:flagellar motor switch/type III secretory pathway protein FliN
VEVFANGRCIGRGEIVVVGDQFGVRITELGSCD